MSDSFKKGHSKEGKDLAFVSFNFNKSNIISKEPKQEMKSN